MIKGVFIDDAVDQQEIYSELLSSDDLDFSTKIEPRSLTAAKAAILSKAPEIVVMDYRLDGERPEGWDNDFRAGGLAQALREAFIEEPEKDLPIVLLSTETNIASLFDPDKTSHDLFDLWYLKEELHSGAKSRRDEILCKLSTLAGAYATIKEERARGDGDDFAPRLLNLSAAEFSEVQSEGLKLLLVDDDGNPERPHVIARRLFDNVIKPAGLLLSQHDLAARLGVDIGDCTEFAKLIETSGLVDCGYEGVYSNGWPRYWRHRFDRWNTRSFEQPLSALNGDERAALLSEKYDVSLRPAVSRWSGRSNEYFSVACRSCHLPTHVRESVAMFEPKLHVFMERGRVCFDCIDREEYKQRRIRIAEGDEETVADIQSRRLQRPEA